MKQVFIALAVSILLKSSLGLAVEVDASTDNEATSTPVAKAAASPDPKPETNAPPKAPSKAPSKATVADAVGEESATRSADNAEESKKPTSKSAAGKSLDGRLSLGTSIGWGIVKPAKGSWNGLGTNDMEVRWRASSKADGKLYYTGRYAPFSGVWTVKNRDYDTTLHGFFGGAEYQKPMPRLTLKAAVELGYMMVYARPQDKAPAAGDVKGGTVNLTAGGGADWSFLSDKVKLGPFARVHVAGFSIFNFGGSAQFVF